jgi:hypothetical protein
MLELHTWELVSVSNKPEENASTYNYLLESALLNRAINRGLSSGEEKIHALADNIVNWLSNTDFYSSPASTRFHEAFEGGLVYHTLKVYNEAIQLIKLPHFRSADIDSAVLVALTHDWCKIGQYESYERNVKDDSGNWCQVSSYRTKENPSSIRLGHGPQSLVMIIQFCNGQYTHLTQEEMAAIRWHMYTYDVSSYDIRDLNTCNDNVPLVHLIQFADQLAIVNY